MEKLRILKLLSGGGIILLAVIYLASFWQPIYTDTVGRRFVFVAPLTDWGNVATGVRDADDAFGSDTKLYGSSELDLKGQFETLRDVILTKPDGIITAAPEQSEELKEVIRLAESSGIPVVLVDSDFPETGRTCYIGTDNLAAGRMVGEDLCRAAGGEAKIGVVVSSLEFPNQQERLRGFREQISKYPKMEILEILEGQSDWLELREQIPEMLQKYPEMDALYLAEAISSAVTADILQEEEFAGRKFTAVVSDNTMEIREALSEGMYASAITQDPYRQGYLAVETLCQFLDGEQVPDIIYTDSFSMDSSNIEETIPNKEDLEWQLY